MAYSSQVPVAILEFMIVMSLNYSQAHSVVNKGLYGSTQSERNFKPLEIFYRPLKLTVDEPVSSSKQSVNNLCLSVPRVKLKSDNVIIGT